MMRLTANRTLALLAGAFALAALLAGDTKRAHDARDQQTIDAVQLASWIRERRPALRVIDLRRRADFEQYHIPNAEHMDRAQLATAEFDSHRTVVLYDDDGTSLDIVDQPGAYVLRDGLSGWLTDIMNPQRPANATADQEQTYQRKRELAEYFGGQASRYGQPTGSMPSTDQLVTKLRRRGC